MPLLPELPVSYEFSISVLYDTIVAEQGGVPIQRRNRSPYGALHRITIRADGLTAEEKTLYQFYSARRGGWEAFSMFDPSIDKQWDDVYLGTGDGIVTNYPLKGKNATNAVITVDGVVNNDWTGEAGGPDGQGVIVFEPAPTGIIKASFTGCRYFPFCVFEAKGLDRKRLSYALHNLGVVIIEVPG